MSNKISVITVVYNDISHIRQTIQSFFSQTWENKEYIVIDGGSTDGTADIIKEYADHLAYWCSEPDDGIYDAMNKAITHCTGDWINVLNSGDLFASENTLSYVMKKSDIEHADIIYGNSIEHGSKCDKLFVASSNPEDLCRQSIYRHGSSFVRAEVQKRFPYDLKKKEFLGYALDSEMIYRMFQSGCKFVKVDTVIEIFIAEGVSNHVYRNLWYNYKIRSEGKFKTSKVGDLIKMTLRMAITHSSIYPFVKALGTEFMVNDVFPIILFWSWRKAYLKLLGTNIGKGSFIMKNNYFMSPWLLKIGEFSHINRGCLIDARAGLKIGNNVSISHNVNIITGSHDVHSKQFASIMEGIEIKDFAWLGAGCTILKGVHVGKGAVVCAGAVVTKDVDDFTIVGGIPAQKIGDRRHDLDYHCYGYMPLT